MHSNQQFIMLCIMGDSNYPACACLYKHNGQPIPPESPHALYTIELAVVQRLYILHGSNSE